MNIYTPYTYLIGWTEHDKWYYGVRVANKCEPENDLWKEYFTSSKYVQEFREKCGEPDIIQIDETFTEDQKAIDYERKFIKSNNCITEEKWLNKGQWPVIGRYERTEAHRTHLSELAKASAWGKATRFKKGHKQVISSETKRKISETRKRMFTEGKLDLSGENGPSYGKKRPEYLNVLQRKRLGKPVVIDNIRYDSVKYAAECLNTNRTWLRTRLKSDKYPNFLYVRKD